MQMRFPFIGGGKIAGEAPAEPCGPLKIERGKDGRVYIRNIDQVSSGERAALLRDITKTSELPSFEGHVEHGYAAATVADLERCPRCGDRTERSYANFIYCTQEMLRVAFAPAGLFCASCPSVIVDEDLIVSAISDKRFRYQCTIGIDFEKKREPEYFRTWNGEDLVYVFDEDKRLVEVTTRAEYARSQVAVVSSQTVVSSNLSKKKAIKKKRDKLAKQSRKKNRKK